MTILDIHGVTRRRKRVWTTRSDGSPRSPDLVERNFTAESPNELWVTDLTYVPTWSGVAYVAFIVDVYSRMIVGWRVAAHMRTDMVLDALNMAAWNRNVDLAGLVTHSDAGSSSHPSDGPNVSSRSARHHRSDPLAIPTTTPSPRR